MQRRTTGDDSNRPRTDGSWFSPGDPAIPAAPARPGVRVLFRRVSVGNIDAEVDALFRAHPRADSTCGRDADRLPAAGARDSVKMAKPDQCVGTTPLLRRRANPRP